MLSVPQERDEDFRPRVQLDGQRDPTKQKIPTEIEMFLKENPSTPGARFVDLPRYGILNTVETRHRKLNESCRAVLCVPPQPIRIYAWLERVRKTKAATEGSGAATGSWPSTWEDDAERSTHTQFCHMLRMEPNGYHRWVPTALVFHYYLQGILPFLVNQIVSLLSWVRLQDFPVDVL